MRRDLSSQRICGIRCGQTGGVASNRFYFPFSSPKIYSNAMNVPHAAMAQNDEPPKEVDGSLKNHPLSPSSHEVAICYNSLTHVCWYILHYSHSCWVVYFFLSHCQSRYGEKKPAQDVQAMNDTTSCQAEGVVGGAGKQDEKGVKGAQTTWVISHVPMFHITQPWSVLMVYKCLLDGYYFRWCPIFPFYGTFTNPWASILCGSEVGAMT